MNHYYKILHNQKVIDLVNDPIRYVRYQTSNQMLIACKLENAMGFISDSGKCYHLSYQKPFPIDEYLTVSLEEISEIEYDMLKNRLLMSVDEIREELLIDLMERGVL